MLALKQSPFYQPNTDKSASGSWIEEQLLASGDLYLSSLESGLLAAQRSVELEFYIFRDDHFGKRLEGSLIAAAKRGVRVRVSVDGVGSIGWLASIGKRLKANGIEVKVYHPIFGEKLLSRIFSNRSALWNFFKSINKRNHRKLCIIDDSNAWLGSINASEHSLASVHGRRAWREMGVRVSGENVKFLKAAFDYSWYPLRWKFFQIRKKARGLLNQSRHSPVRLNNLIGLRRYFFRQLIAEIDAAESKVWISNPYFIPSSAFSAALTRAASRGVDVIVITALKSDVFFIPWVSAKFQRELIKAGVKLAAYEPSILHAKFIIIDKSVIIGSSNINSRSLHHDLEADIVSDREGTLKQLSTEFANDLLDSKVIDLKNIKSRPFWQNIFAQVALFFRDYL